MKCWLSSVALTVSAEVEASTDLGLGLTMGGLANGLACPTPTAFRASVTANVTTLVKSMMLTGSAVCCAAETSTRSLKVLEDGVAHFVILAALCVSNTSSKVWARERP